MNDIQELISRGRILFTNAPKRFFIFSLLNGKFSAKNITKKTGRSLSSVLQDLQKMRDLGLIISRKDKAERVVKKNDSIVYDKNPLIKHLSKSYFEGTLLPSSKPSDFAEKFSRTKNTKKSFSRMAVPNEQQCLDIFRSGENQLYEFKQSGTEMRNTCKEIAAFAHTRQGGIIFYGVEDDGAVGDTDKSRHNFDESIQNSVRNNINPSISITVIEKNIIGHKIILIQIQPWNRKVVYLFDGRAYIRKGNVVFVVKPDEHKKLYKGEYID